MAGVGHENPIDANLLASPFNLINDNLPHTVTPHNSYNIYITLDVTPFPPPAGVWGVLRV